jgi:GNAT superfamily N-acetyltransferase
MHTGIMRTQQIISASINMNISIREATEADFPSILFLIKELAEFEKAPEKVTNTVEQMKKEKDYFQGYVAETDDKEIVGMAVYYFVYYTWVGKSIYLEDIFVKDSYRGKKIGFELMKKIFETAKSENCKRIRWQVLNWNSTAIEMYRKLGAEVSYEWLNCTVEADGIRDF